MRTILWARWSWPPEREQRSGMPMASGITVRMERLSTPGQKWKVGRLEIEAISTPGHTPGSMSYLLRDPSGLAWMVFTGDALFAGEVGRIDLHGPGKGSMRWRPALRQHLRQALAPGRRGHRLSGSRSRVRLRRVDCRAALDHHRPGEKA